MPTFLPYIVLFFGLFIFGFFMDSAFNFPQISPIAADC